MQWLFDNGIGPQRGLVLAVAAALCALSSLHFLWLDILQQLKIAPSRTDRL